MKICLILCLGCALVALGACQDLTALMFQAMGIEAPLMPPVMPRSLREHLYPAQHRQLMLQRHQQQQQQLQQKQRYMAYLAAQQQRMQNTNPYGVPYATSSRSQGQQPRANSVYSSANTIRRPGSANSVGLSKGNPYSSSRQDATVKTAPGFSKQANPYSVSRAASSGVPAIRNSASLPASMAPVPIPPQATRILRSMQQMKAVREQPRRITDAKAAGCTLPGEGMYMLSDCRTAQMLCATEMLSCVKVGMAAMCCPYGMNNLALDTIGYMNKLQHFVAEFA